MPAIFCKVDLGYLISTPVSAAKYKITFRGNHGYDNAEPDMLALFVAHGPAFKKGLTIKAFDNIDLYPMLAHVLGVTPEKVDGKLATLNPILAN